MREVVRVLHHRDVLLGYAGLAEALDNVTLYTPGHWADEPFRRRRRERRTYSEQLRYERRIARYPVAHYDLASRFRGPDHRLSDVIGLSCKHRTTPAQGPLKRIIIDDFQIAG